MGLMALVNILALVLLSGVAMRVINDYRDQLSAGVSPVFDKRNFPDLQAQIDSDIRTGEPAEAVDNAKVAQVNT
jgi:AGCS family alanine or glycine:cation symporter